MLEALNRNPAAAALAAAALALVVLAVAVLLLARQSRRARRDRERMLGLLRRERRLPTGHRPARKPERKKRRMTTAATRQTHRPLSAAGTGFIMPENWYPAVSM